jgi:gas vesicle protein
MDIGSLTGQIAIEDQLTGKLTQITSSVKRFAESFDGALGASVVGAGAVAAAVAGIAISINSLGDKGSIILGVEESFDRLARTAGSTGEELINGLNRGVRDTVDSMVLMESTNRLLSSGMQLSGKDMELMGAVAREMGKATGQDAAGGLNTLSSALLTGNTRSLRRFGIQVDLVKAEKDFAKSLGATRSELSYEGKLQADRNAMLEAMRQKLDTLGVSELSFKEKIMQGKIAIGNWHDALAKAVAGSPQINRALDSIKDAFARVVGSESQNALDFLMKWANRFADSVAEAMPKIATFLENVKIKIGELWDWLVDFNERWQITNTLVTVGKKAWDMLQSALQFVGEAITEVKRAWADLPEWLQKLTKGALESAIAIGTYTVAINAVATPFAALLSKLDLGINVVGNLTGAVYNLQHLTWVWQTPINAVANAYTALTARLAANTAAQWISATATNAVANAKVFWTLIVTGAGNALTVLATKIGITTIAQNVSALASKALAAAQAFLRGVVFALSLEYMTLMTRLGASTAGMVVQTAASKGLAVAQTGAALGSVALGTALTVLKWAILPLTVGFLAFKGVLEGMDWLGVSKYVEYFSLRVQKAFGAFQGATNDDLWNSVMENQKRRLQENGDAAMEAALKAKLAQEDLQRLQDNMSGKSATDELAKMDEVYRNLSRSGPLAADVVERMGRQIQALEQQGGKASPALVKLREEYEKLAKKKPDPNFLRIGEGNIDKVAEMIKTLTKAPEAIETFEKAFEKLTGSQRSSWDVQQRLVAEIDRYIASGKRLTPQMEETYNAYTGHVAAIRAASEASLQAQNVTAEEVAMRQKNGESLIGIAYSYGVTAENLSLYIEKLKQSATDEETAAAARMSAWQKWHDRQQSFYDAGVALEEEYKQMMVASAGETAATRVAAIQKTLQAELDRLDQLKLMGRVEESEANKQIDLRKKIAGEQIAIVNGLSRTIETRMRAQGVFTRRELQQTALDAIRDYSQMKAAVGVYSDAQIEAAEKAAKAAMDAANGTGKWRAAVVEIADAIGDMFEGINSNVAQAVHVFARGLATMVDNSKTSATRIAAAFATAASVMNSLLGPNKGRAGSAATGALSGAASGVAAGAAIGSHAGPTGTIAGGIIGGVVGGIGGLIGGWNSGGAAQRTANADATKQIREYQAELLKTYGSMNNIRMLGQQLGVDLAGAWGDQGQAGLAHFSSMMDELNGKFQQLRDSLDRYGLSWRDLNEQLRQYNLDQIADGLIADFRSLTGAGVDADLAIKRMGPALSQLVIDAQTTGTKIPKALQPILEKLIRMNGLTEEASRALLGMAQNSGPSLDEVTAAAERYGLKLDDLGPKVQQLRITETANQIAADFETLTAAGVPFEVMMKDTTKRVTDTGASFDSMSEQAQKAYLDAGGVVSTVTTGMHNSIQEMVTKAMASGAELPRSMQPIIAKLIEAGGPNGLVDQFGNALTDVSQLNFAADLSGMFEELITKLDKLISKITNGVGGALDGITDRDFNWNYNEDPGRGDESRGYAGGGVVYAAGGYRARGTDIVPAMLTPGERVLTVAENREYERGGREMVMAPIIMEGIKVAEALVVTKRRHGLGRGRR